MHYVSNRDTHLYPPHSNSSVHLTTTTYVQRSGPITDGMRSCCWTTLQDSVFSSPTAAPTLQEWSCQEQPRSGLTVSAPVSDVSAPACTNGVWLPLQFETLVHTHPDWLSQEEPGSGSTASAPVSDVSIPACKNGVWPPLRPVSVAQNKPSTMSSSTVQSIDPPHWLHGLTVLDDETTEWLLNTCPDI